MKRILFVILFSFVFAASFAVHASRIPVNEKIKKDSSIIQKKEFKIAGIQVRTSNKREGKDMAALWEKYYSGNYYEKIKNKVNPNEFYEVFTDYESDENGEYNYIIGFEVSSFNGMPEEIVTKNIPTAKYIIFSKTGIFPDIAWEVWEEIWASDYNRSFKADFNVYDLRNLFSDSAEIKTYLGVKK